MLALIRKAREEREGGFTLIELLVVIIIIGILAAIAIPVFLNQRKKGYDAQVKSDLRNAATAEETYLTDSPNSYTTDQTALATAGWKTSTNDTFQVAISGATGYCIVGNNSSSTNAFAYDSGKGGLQATVFTGATPAAALTAAQAGCTSITSPAFV
jgi:type IV pilus assembly protein PilA